MNSKSAYRIVFTDGLEVVIRAINEQHASMSATMRRNGFKQSGQKVVSRIEKIEDGNSC